MERVTREFVRAMSCEGHVVLGTTPHGRMHVYGTTASGVRWIENRMIRP